MGSTTADFLVGGPIGQGSFGTVLHCQHKATGQQVAIKVVPKVTMRRYPQQLQAVLQEQKLLRQLSECPYLVTLLASFHDEECLYLVMECCEGGDLDHVIRHGRRLGDWLVRAAVLARELMCAIEALHSQKIVHADLKPSNILFSRQGRLALADLGSAVDLKQSQGAVSNLLRGTPEYAAPELIRAEHTITTAVDLWSYGCILCALWTGESPFHADSEVLVVQRVLDYVSLEDTARQSVVPVRVPTCNSWRDLILLLLNPYPSFRAAADGDFSSIRLTWNSILGDQKVPDFSYVEPRWLIESRQTNMKDGSIGWAAFLID